MRSLAPKADRGTNNGAAARVEARKVLRSCGMGVMYQEYVTPMPQDRRTFSMGVMYQEYVLEGRRPWPAHTQLIGYPSRLAIIRLPITPARTTNTSSVPSARSTE